MKKKIISFEKIAFKEDLYKFLMISKYMFSLNKGITIGIVLYILGLISVIDPTANMIAKNLLGTSHDTITRAICLLSDNFYNIVMFMLNSIQANTPVSGWLIIDDVLLHKQDSKHTNFVSTVLDHTTGKYTAGIQVVVLLWSNGFMSFPIGFKVYLSEEYAKSKGKEFKTKIQLAIDLLQMPIVSSIPFDFIAFDTWYAAKDLLNYINGKGLKYITMVKCNRSFKVSGKRVLQRSQDISTSFAVTQYRYNSKLGFYLKGMEAKLKGVGDVKLVIVKNGYRASIKQTRFIVTNMMDLSAPMAVTLYFRRWDIEVFFRATKQLLSLENFLFRKAEAILGHICAVFLAYFFLEYLKISMNRSTVGEIKVLISNTHEILVNGESFIVYNSENRQRIMPSLPHKNLITTMFFEDTLA